MSYNMEENVDDMNLPESEHSVAGERLLKPATNSYESCCWLGSDIRRTGQCGDTEMHDAGVTPVASDPVI